MATIKVKMGEGIESNCLLSGVPVKAGETVEVSDSDARYVVSRGLGKYVKTDTAPVTVNPVEVVQPKPVKPAKEEEQKPTEPAKAATPEKETGAPVELEDMGFGELKDLAASLGVRITKDKGRVLKQDFIDAIRSTQKGAKAPSNKE